MKTALRSAKNCRKKKTGPPLSFQPLKKINKKSQLRFFNLPAETPCDDRRHSVCPSRPTELKWRARTAETLACPDCRSPPWSSGCRRPSGCPRAAGCPGHPTGCAASPGRLPTHGYLDRKWRNHKKKLIRIKTTFDRKINHLVAHFYTCLVLNRTCVCS